MATFTLRMRDVSFLKPKGRENYLTIQELAREVNRSQTWIRRLEKREKIPRAARVQRGKNSVRLWSPAQVEEIKEVLANTRMGRPKGS